MQKEAGQPSVFMEPELNYDPEAVRSIRDAKTSNLTATQKAIAAALGIGAPALITKLIESGMGSDSDVVAGNLKMYDDLLSDDELLSYMLYQSDDTGE